MQIKNYSKKLLVLFFAILLLVSALPCYTLAASEYKGSGTKKDPYLIESAAQLDGVRNNLSAHYKLANTIDLSSVTGFKPIGYLSRPFTGSFVCDIGTDGLPLYAVKNLTVTVKDTLTSDPNWIKNWTDNINRMEAGLFGASDGASFENIYVLNINVSNDYVGGHTGGIAYGNYIPGQEQKNAAGLIGEAKKTTITGCAATGSINAKTNNVGGLVGLARESTISYSYSKVTVKSTGMWNIGGLVGATNGTDIEQCFASGNVNGAAFSSGGLVGSINGGVVSNSYSTGNLTALGANFVGRLTPGSIFSNCFATGSGGTGTKWEDGDATYTNCHVLSGTTNSQPQFKASSKSNILSAFSGIAGWTASGDLPVLSSVKILSNESKYVPGKTEQPTGSSTSNKTSTAGSSANSKTGTSSTSSTASTEDTASDSVESTGDTEEKSGSTAEFSQMLASLPDDSDLVTLANKDAIKSAKRMYDSFGDAELEAIEQKDSVKLSALCKAISNLMVGDIVSRIEALPETSKLKSSDKENVMAIKDDFDFISDEAKEAIDSGLRDRLAKAVEAVENFKESDTSAVLENKLTAFEWVLVIVLSVLILVVLGCTAAMTVAVIKKSKSTKGVR